MVHNFTSRSHGIRRVVASLGVIALVVAAGSGAVSAAAPNTDNRFTLAVMHDVQNIDPHVSTDLPGRLLAVNLYESLIRFEGDPAVVTPNMAESITASEDATTYTVKLRPGLKFHDGSEVNADAVVYSMDRVLKMGKGAAAPFLDLLDVGDTVALDDLTVQFNLNAASGVFPGTLSFFFIVNPAIIEANKTETGEYGADGDFAESYLQTADAGSGAYTLVSRTPNADLQLEAFPDYWRGWDDDQYGLFTYQVVAEPATVDLLMRQGEIDGAYESFPIDMHEGFASDEDITVNADIGITPLYIFMNNEQPGLDNVKVRQAIAHAFDYDTAIEEILPGAARMTGPLPSTMAGAVTTGGYVQDLDKARALLEESGIDPSTIKLEFASLGGPANLRTHLALLLQANLAEIGIDLAITQNAWADVLTQVTTPETTKSMYGLTLAADYPDPDAFLTQGWDSASHGSWHGSMWYSNPRVDELLASARVTSDQDARTAMYQEAQEILIEESPGIFVANTPVRVSLNNSVGGYDFVVAYYNYQVYDLFKQ